MEAEIINTQFEKEIVHDYRIVEDGLVSQYFDAFFEKQGMQPKWAKIYRKRLIRDWNTCRLPSEQKIWAVEQGFFPSNFLLYGLTKDNYSQYLSDMDYVRIHPLNNHFAFWINDSKGEIFVNIEFAISTLFRLLMIEYINLLFSFIFS